MAFEKLLLTATVRSELGKGPSHRLRKSGLVPAVVYAGGKESTSVALEPKDASRVLLTPLRRNVVFTLQVQDDAGAQKGSKVVMVRDVQVHPVRRTLLHMDMIEIDPAKNVTVTVPLVFTGRSKSVTAGGKLEQVCRGIHISCSPAQIPEKIEFDVTELPFGTTHASAISLPAGTSLAESHKAAIATIRQPRADKDDTASSTPNAAPVVTTGAAAREAAKAAS